MDEPEKNAGAATDAETLTHRAPTRDDGVLSRGISD